MRLYLSSYLWGNQPQKLFRLIGNGPKKVGIITNSADQFPEAGIVSRLNEDIAYLAEHGLTAERLDLREYFDSSEVELERKIRQFGLVWARGANVFVLRRSMRQSGFDRLLVRLLEEDSIVYGGYSAGACVLGSTLKGLDLVDDAAAVPDGYDQAVIWEGLGVLPYAIAPHYSSNHPESTLIDEAIAYFEEQGTSYKALRDGEAILVDGDKTEKLS